VKSRPGRITQAVITTTAAVRKPTADANTAPSDALQDVQWVPATLALQGANNQRQDKADSAVEPASGGSPQGVKKPSEDVGEACLEWQGSSGTRGSSIPSVSEPPTPQAAPASPGVTETVPGVSQEGQPPLEGGVPKGGAQDKQHLPPTPQAHSPQLDDPGKGAEEEGCAVRSPNPQAMGPARPAQALLSSEQIQQRMGQLQGALAGEAGWGSKDSSQEADLQRTPVKEPGEGVARGGGDSSGSKASGQLYDILMESLNSPAESVCQSKLVSFVRS